MACQLHCSTKNAQRWKSFPVSFPVVFLDTEYNLVYQIALQRHSYEKFAIKIAKRATLVYFAIS